MEHYNLLYLNSELMNWADFVHARTYSGKLMVKYGCGFLGHGALKSAVSQE